MFFDSCVRWVETYLPSSPSPEESKEARSHGATSCRPSIQGSRSRSGRLRAVRRGGRVGSGMAPISFARGAPAPECIDPELVADCARVALERDGRTILSYGVGGGYGPLRELLAERHGVEPGPRVPDDRRPAGLRLLRRRAARAGAGRVLVEGPTYDRPLKLLGWQGAEVVRAARWTTRASTSTRSRRSSRAAATSRSSTRSRPSRTRAGARSATERRRRLARSSPSTASTSSRTIPYGLVRYEGDGAALAARARGRRARHASRRRSRRRSRPGLRVGYVRRARGAARGATTTAPSRRTSRRRSFRRRSSTSSSPAAASSRTSTACAGMLRARRDAMLAALEESFAGRATWSRPEGGYFLWVDFDGVSSADLLQRATDGGRDVRARLRLLPGGRGRRERGAASPSATRRPSGSPRAFGSWPALLRTVSPSPRRLRASQRGTNVARSAAERHAQEDEPDEARLHREEDEADVLALGVHQQEHDRVDTDRGEDQRTASGSRRRAGRAVAHGAIVEGAAARRRRQPEAAAARRSGARARGCGGGSSRPVAARKVGHGTFPASAHRPSRRK